LSLRLSKHALYSLKPITKAAAANPSTTIATMVHSNAPKRDHIVSSLPSPCLAPCEAPTGHAEADAYSPRLIRAITKPVFSIVETSNVNGSLSRVSACGRKPKVEMLSLSLEPDILICSPSRLGGRRIAAIAPSATMPANSGLLARYANFIHELSCVVHQGAMKYDALAIMYGFTGGRRIC